jgi:FkbM family methyltransferase
MINAPGRVGDVEQFRRLPFSNSGLVANAKKLALIRSTFRNWLLPTLAVPFATVLARRHRLSWLTSSLEGIGVTLFVRANGARVRAPILDVWPAFEVFAFREYDFSVFRWERIRTVVDIGAHVGSFSLWLSAHTPCQIVAVEPNPVAYRFLQENVASLGRSISSMSLALAGSNGERTIYDAGFPGISSFSSSETSRSFQVEAITLEELLNRTGFAEVDLLKMDIEGAEREVFDTISVETLERIHSAIIECHPKAGTKAEEIADKLIQAGMTVASEPRMIVAWRE